MSNFASRATQINASVLSKSEATAQFKQVMKEIAVLAKDQPWWGDTPLEVLQNDDRSLKAIYKGFAKMNNSKGMGLTRKAYGFMVLAEIWIPF